MMFWNPCGENFVEPQTRCYHRRMTLSAQGLKLENFTVAYALFMAAYFCPSVQVQRIARSVLCVYILYAGTHTATTTNKTKDVHGQLSSCTESL
jgi:hypothetical protein